VPEAQSPSLVQLGPPTTLPQIFATSGLALMSAVPSQRATGRSDGIRPVRLLTWASRPFRMQVVEPGTAFSSIFARPTRTLPIAPVSVVSPPRQAAVPSGLPPKMFETPFW